ncbi:MAG: bifunctional NAD(P)/FAD-dependent oxidoreductase/class I SAM-dependent methyltransferase [Actinomycetota bacterium]
MDTSTSSQGFERHCDVAIVGGSAAGLAAALQLGRQRRSVIVIDSGEPRNAPASQMHSYLGHEGLPPSELAAIARREVRSYGGEILDGRVADVVPAPDGRFRVVLVGAHAVVARRVLVATGVVDELPEIDGMAELWGTDVIHCPFCHGYEVRDQRIVQIITSPIGLHPAGLFRQLTDRYTLVLHEGVDPESPDVETFRHAGVDVIASRVRRLSTDDRGRLAAVELVDGRSLDADAVAIATRFGVRVDALASLGVDMAEHPTGLGAVVSTQPTGETSVPGVFAAGNVVDPSQQVLQAAADGSRVAGMICFSLASEDLRAGQHGDQNQTDWEHRYRDADVWSGNPNGALVNETNDLRPGTALDIGAGEGADAIWLARQGWTVTAIDIAQNAVDQITEHAAAHSLDIDAIRADVNSLHAIEPRAFDLVTLQYGAIPRTPDDRAIHNIINGVAPGGALLIVGHADHPTTTPTDPDHPSRMFDRNAYFGVEDFERFINSRPEWDITVSDQRPRPAGSATDHLHHTDTILKARLER